VLSNHQLPSGNSIAETINTVMQEDLIAFLKTIDARTAPLRSQADDFRDLIAP
jgi:hypothetical protein